MNALSTFIWLSLMWTPRIVCILFAIFISLFSFDVLGQNEGFWKTLLAFLMHLTPTFLIILLLVLSWKWPWIGGISFILLGIAYIIWQKTEYPFIYVSIFLVGVFFLISWLFRNNIRKARETYRRRMGINRNVKN